MKSVLMHSLLQLILLTSVSFFAQVGIGTTSPAASSILDIQSTTMGVLIPRMTITQRDNILTPAQGLQIYNTTNNTSDIYSNGVWKTFAFSVSSNLVYVYSLADLPTPVSSGITLDATKIYIFSGIVDISPNYIILNGAGLIGTDPQKDGVMSSVAGAVLRSTNTSVYMENFAVIPLTGATKAYDFSDSTGTKFCNLFSGCSVIEVGTPSLGVGQISGFEAVTYIKNYWNVTDGLKLTGNIGKFAGQLNYLKGITSGSAIEFLSGITIQDVDLSSNYFFYTGQTGIKLNAGATIDRGRLTSNMFRGVGTPLLGLTPYDIGWRMVQNTNIPDTRAYCYIYMNGNTTATTTSPNNTYVKVAGTTTATKLLKFSSPASNRITFLGKDPIVASVDIIVSGKSPANSAEFTIAVYKNGSIVTGPVMNTGTMTQNQAFSLILNTEVDMVTNDYVEVFIKTTSSTTPLIIADMQFKIRD